MARFDKLTVLSEIKRTTIVPVFHNSDIETSCRVLKACYQGGIRVFEFTNRGDSAHEVFRLLVLFAKAECPDMIVGIGSIVEPATASLYMQLGANFIVGPLFNPEVARICNRRMVPYIAGCATATEIGTAQEAGCDICKVFPADTTGGPQFIKNILAPMPWSRLMATGGVEPTRKSISAWIKAGAFALGIGSKLFPEGLIEEKKWAEISAACQNCLEYAAESKGI